MTPKIAVGMDGSIPGCTFEKNRWLGKALFTVSHEWDVLVALMVFGLTPSRASPLPQWICGVRSSNVGAGLLAKDATRCRN